MLVSLLMGFFLGALALAAAEGLALWWFVRRLGRKKLAHTEGDAAGDVGALGRDLSSERWTTFPYKKKGSLWVLEQEKLPKSSGSDSQGKGSKDQKAKNVIVEVVPVKKTATLNEHSLTLVDTTGSERVILLLDCTVVAVSGSKLPSRKWFKKYPIKVENKNTTFYNGRNTCYLYAETSWEKESWCKALRLASCADGSLVLRHSVLRKNFHTYLASLSSEYPLFQKHVSLSGESVEKNIKVDEQPSKFRHLFRKFVKKAPKYGDDYKANCDLVLAGDKRGTEKMQNTQDSLSANGSVRSSMGKSSIYDLANPISPEKRFPECHQALTADAASEEHLNLNEECLCLNLLFSRIFFDIKESQEVKNFIKARLQRTFTNMRLPSFVGGLNCNNLDLGSLPPYIRDMRALAVDANEMWAVELDIQYTGGFLLDIQSRIDIREPELQKKIDSSLEASSSGEVASVILEGLECYTQELRLSNDLPVEDVRQDTGDKQECLEQSKSIGWAKSRWRTILNSVAEQVSQVPLSMAIKVCSLRGTLRLHIKAPPSDQLWFGFTSMPDVDFKLDSSVGERNIKSTHVGLFIANRLKVAIHDSVVLPNCESICMPWMIAEKDDWVPRKDAPFLWSRQENSDSLASDGYQAGESKSKAGNAMKTKRCSPALNAEDDVENSSQKAVVSESVSGSTSESLSSRSSLNSLPKDIPLDELRTPSLGAERTLERRMPSTSSSTDYSLHSSSLVSGQNPRPSDDAGGKKTGRRARMMDIGKKVTEKFEEKRRHIEEKGRYMVEKMRENVKAASDGNNSQRI